jgi:putative ABC transport system permease protein
MKLFLDTFAQTVRTLWAHKVRSFLTMFGIAWGVGSLLLLVGLGEGFRSGNRRQLENIGQDIMFVFGGRIPAVPGSAVTMRPFKLTYQDYLDVKTQTTSLRAVAPVIQRSDIQVQSEFASGAGQVHGVFVEQAGIRKLDLGEGRWLNERDLEGERRVAVINEEMSKTLFPGKPAVGAQISLNGVSFHVVGVLAPPPQQGGGGPPPMAMNIPFTTMRMLFPLKEENTENAISVVNYQPLSRDLHEAAKTEVRKIIARNHGFDYTIEEAWFDWDTVESQEMVGKIFTAMNWFLGGVGTVTLSLGAIGIINIMLVSVTERTPEIGLRKALGATNHNILLQFFLEGVTLTFMSGIIGILFAAALVTALSTLPQPPGFDTPRIVPWSAALAIGFLGTCGVVAGLYPARKAALLTPVEALRKD